MLLQSPFTKVHCSQNRVCNKLLWEFCLLFWSYRRPTALAYMGLNHGLWNKSWASLRTHACCMPWAVLRGGGFKYFQTHMIKRCTCQKSLFPFFHYYEPVNVFEKSLSCLMCQQKYIWNMADNLNFDLPRILVNISVQRDKINFYWTRDMGIVDNLIIDFRFWTNIPLLPVKHCIDWTNWNCSLMTPCNIAIIQAVNFMGQCWEECRLCNV